MHFHHTLVTFPTSITTSYSLFPLSSTIHAHCMQFASCKMADPAVKPCKSSERFFKQPVIRFPAVDQDTVNPFITSTSLAKPNEATRKLIRSHVMRGKNVRKPVGAASSLKPGSRPHENEDNCQGRNELPRVRTEFSGSGLSVVRFAAETTPYMRDRILTCKAPFIHVQ